MCGLGSLGWLMLHAHAVLNLQAGAALSGCRSCRASKHVHIYEVYLPYVQHHFVYGHWRLGDPAPALAHGNVAWLRGAAIAARNVSTAGVG